MPSKDQSLFSKRLAAAGLDRIKLVGDQEPSPPLTAKSIQRQWSELRADEHCSGDLILQARGMCDSVRASRWRRCCMLSPFFTCYRAHTIPPDRILMNGGFDLAKSREGTPLSAYLRFVALSACY